MFVTIVNDAEETSRTNKIIYEFPCNTTYSYYDIENESLREEDQLFLGDRTIKLDKDTLLQYDSSFQELLKLIDGDDYNISDSGNKKTKFLIGTYADDVESFLSYMNTMKSVDNISYLQSYKAGCSTEPPYEAGCSTEPPYEKGILYLISYDMILMLKAYNSQRKFTLPLKHQVDIIHKLHKPRRGYSFYDSTELTLPEKKTLSVTQLVKLIKQYVNEDGFVYWIPNEGNGGDAFIALGTIHFFKVHNIKYRIVKERSSIKEGQKLVYSGGGNLVFNYPQCETVLNAFSEKHKMLILPHTVDKVDLLKGLSSNVTIIARDMTSYYICKKHFKHDTYLHRDMAFYLEIPKTRFKYQFNEKRIKIMNCFRNDVERTITKVDKNIDLPQYINYDRYMRNESLIEKTVVDILDVLYKYEIVHTNRLHMCIACHLLGGIKVNFFNNSYWKNREVYKYSPLMENRLISFNGLK